MNKNEYYNENKDKYREYKKEYNEENKDAMLEHNKLNHYIKIDKIKKYHNDYNYI